MPRSNSSLSRSHETHPVHPLGQSARVLLSSVFGPYAQDDAYGSRSINPMELYHNQVTRVQGGFSVRLFHRTWGLMLIQANIRAPCTVLDFPTLDRFIEEITTKHYDIIGISAIVMNVQKVRKMCEVIREHAPQAVIVVGGHVVGLPELDRRIDADHIARGEGVRWMRRFLSEDESQPIRHPQIYSGVGMRAMGITVHDKVGNTAATVIPSVGCPLGCTFCSTSAMFGGKGNFVNFYETGDELFEAMCELERSMRVKAFFIMDENFLLHKKRALRLLELMSEHHKAWAFYVFSSANILRTYSIEQLVGLGIWWVWIGLEGKDSKYSKLKGIDTRELVRMLQSHGICTLGSTIIGLEEHTPENIDEAIDYAVSHNTDFHQFMLYTPVPGTPLYTEHVAKGTLLKAEECPEADIHGQLKFNYKHPNIKDGQETQYLINAFQRDFDVNGPSIMRLTATVLRGWRRYKAHPQKRIRERFAWCVRELPISYAGAIWAIKRQFRSNPLVSARVSTILKDLYDEFGLKTRLAAPLVGRYILNRVRREYRRLERGWTYEPPTFYDLQPLLA